MLQDGDKAPDFQLPDAGEELIRLSGFKGRPVVLYFYPKDDTSGCTQEAKDFTCLAQQFETLGAEILGVSPDSAISHKAFATKYGLSVRLVADEEKKVANLYGVWVEKSMYGKKYMGVERSTFLIDCEGGIAKSWRKVRVPGHAEEVLSELRKLAKT